MRHEDSLYSELDPRIPPDARRLGHLEAEQAEHLDEPRKDDDAPVVAAAGGHDAAADGDADEAGEADDGVARGVVAAVLLRVAQLADAHGRDGDVAAGAEPEEHGEDDDAREGVARRQPHAQASDDRDQHREHVAVERPDDVGPVARQQPAEDGGRVEDGQDVEAEALVEAGVQGVRRDVGDGDEEGELEHEDAYGREQKGRVLEDFEVGVHARVARGRQPLVHEQVADGGQEEAHEAHDPQRPRPAEAVEQALQDQREDDASHAAARAGDARSQPAPLLEEVTDGREARCKDQRCTDAVEEREDEDKVPIF